MRVSVQRIRTAEPLRPTLATMSRAAHEAARTWTLQEHVGRLAAEAGPRDYVGQLRALYDDFVTKRWRYVMEPGERVPGSGRALLGHVLGAGYNSGPECRSPEECATTGAAWKRGFGDCDDASAYIAAGALALGMTPSWRVARWRGGAHVSVIVDTPRGQRVSVDPVGYPENPFGWALEPPGGSITEYALDPAEGNAMAGSPQHMQTWYHGRRGIRVGRMRPHVVLTAANDDRGARVLAMPQWANRVFKRNLVVPRARAYDQFGELYEYVSGWDAWAPVNGGAYDYNQPPAPLGSRAEKRAKRKAKRAARKAARMQRRGKRKAVRKARFKRFKSKVKGFFVKVRKTLARVLKKISQSKIAKFYRKLKSKFLKSKLVQGAIGTVLSAFGVPRKVTQAVMEREAALADRGGRSTLAALVAAGKWGEAAKIVGGSFVDAGKAVVANLIPGGGALKKVIGGAGALKKVVGLSGYDGLSGFESEALAGLHESHGHRWVMSQGGRMWNVAPVAALTGVSGVYLAGQLEVSETPESGRWYRIQPGDTLLGIVGDAFGVGPGGKRLAIAKWINASAANQCLHTTEISDTEKGWFGGSRISFKPKFSCSREEQERCTPGSCYAIVWLAPAAGVEPPEAPDEPIEPEPDEPDPDEPIEPEEPDEPDPDEPEDTPPIDPPPPPPIEPDDPDPPDDVPEEPDPEPVGPPMPPEPDDPDPVDDEPDEPPAPDPDEPEDEPDEPEDEPEPAVVDLPDPLPPPGEPWSPRAALGTLGLLWVALAEGRGR